MLEGGRSRKGLRRVQGSLLLDVCGWIVREEEVLIEVLTFGKVIETRIIKFPLVGSVLSWS